MRYRVGQLIQLITWLTWLNPLFVNGQPQINRQNMHKGLFGVDLLPPFVVEITVCAILHYCALSLYYVMF